MARGRLLKTKKREAYHLAKAEEKGRAQARKESLRKKGIREYLEELWEKLEVKDATKMVAVLGMTFLVKQSIDTYEDIRKALDNLGFGPRFRLGPVNPFVRSPLLSALGLGPWANQTDGDKEGVFPEQIDWLISFTLAYIIVHNFGSIMQGVGSMASTVPNLVRGLLVGGVSPV